MGLLAVDEQHGAADLARVGQDRRIEECERRGAVPTLVGVERPHVVAARGLVVGVVIPDELRRIVGQRVHNPAGAGVVAATEVLRALGGQLPAQGMARVIRVAGVEVAVGRAAADVVHRRGYGGPDARVDGRGVERETAPAADADDGDPPGIGPLERREEVDRRREILGGEVGRGHVARLAAALARERGVEGQGQETPLGEGLGIEPRRLLLDRSERARDGHGGQRPRGVAGRVEVGRQRDAEAVAEGDFGVSDLVALREGLVPVAGQSECLHLRVVGLSVHAAGRRQSGQKKCGDCFRFHALHVWFILWRDPRRRPPRGRDGRPSRPEPRPLRRRSSPPDGPARSSRSTR